MSQHLTSPKQLCYSLPFQIQPSYRAEVSSDSAPQLRHIQILFSDAVRSAFIRSFECVLAHALSPLQFADSPSGTRISRFQSMSHVQSRIYIRPLYLRHGCCPLSTARLASTASLILRSSSTSSPQMCVTSTRLRCAYASSSSLIAVRYCRATRPQFKRCTSTQQSLSLSQKSIVKPIRFNTIK